MGETYLLNDEEYTADAVLQQLAELGYISLEYDQDNNIYVIEIED